jgi:acyl transferase domain-containing protein/NADPH:quinone reductase-like Zn-dependent oxidoreductase/acyl carrier protein
MSIHEAVAVVGFAARLPGARDVPAFWSLLHDRHCAIGLISANRFSSAGFYHPSADQKGRSYTFAAGLIDDVWGFDAGAFGMSPREAEQVDPQQRHLLEVTFDALTHAGIKASSLAGSRTGVFVGASSVDYGARFFSDPAATDVHMMTGNTLSILSNRISYVLNAKGPSFTVDTACSSSLVALSLASDAIRNGTVDTAIVAGVNLLLSPFSFIGFSRASMLSPTGLCRPFDAAADGYVRAEGVVVAVLRSVAAARQANNRVYATVLGTAVGQDGRTTGLSLPSSESQRELLDRIYDEAAIDPADLAFVEAHGTGTRAGDPIEADALGRALGQRRSQPLPIGSVKSNIGHLEPASGLAGVLKAILALNEGVLPATLHQTTPNPDIRFDELNLRVVDRNWRLPEVRGPSLAGVNSFGFGGTNAHVILRGGDFNVRPAYSHADIAPPPLLLSAYSQEALRDVAEAHVRAWPSDPRQAIDFIAAAAHHRDALPHRAIILGNGRDEIRRKLENFAEAADAPSVITGRALGHELPVAFLFSGNGSQWAGMGRAAWHANPRFREALQEVGDQFERRRAPSPVDLLFAEDLAPRLRRASVAQPLLLAIQVATVRALEAQGLVPAATLGHSVGEIAAAWCAGVLTLDQAIDVVIARSRHLENVRGKGGMVAIMLSERETRRFLASHKLEDADIAAINSWRSVTVSGPLKAVDALLRAAAEAKIGARRLDLDYPYHSALLEPVRSALLRELHGLNSSAPRKGFVSSTTGSAIDRENLGPEHWWRNMREPVRFDVALSRLVSDGFQVFVEVGPKPILLSYVRHGLRDANVPGLGIETLTDADPAGEDPIERCVARVFAGGGQIEARRLFGAPPPLAAPLPAYPWHHAQYQVALTAEASTTFLAPPHPLVGRRPRRDSLEWYSTVDPDLFPWLRDHGVGGVPVFPAAAYVEAALAVAAEVHGDAPLELRDMDIVRPLVFDGSASFETLVRLHRENGVVEFFSRQRGSATDWSLNARGMVARCPTPPDRPEIDSGPVIVPKSKVYEVSRGLGLDYGPAFQRVRRVSFPEPKRAMAVLEEEAMIALPGRVTDLTALDAAFHALFASEEAGVADMPMKRMLPIRFGRVRVHALGATARHAIARTIRQSLSSMVIDVELVDAAGDVVLTADAVRLVEAPVAGNVDLRTLTYRTDAWALQRAGAASSLASHDWPKREAPKREARGQALSEALLLLEAGCLRETWAAFQGEKPPSASSEPPTEETEWPAYLVSSLLWHLETRNLVREHEGELVLADTCDLPAVDSVIRTLLRRHPTMGAEAASLARLGEIIERLVAGDSSASAELSSAHWRQLDIASEQISLMREAVEHELMRAVQRRKDRQFVRLLLVGAHHSALLAPRFEHLPGVEIVITDFDDDRLDQARASLGDDMPFIRCVAWPDLENWPAATMDLVGAVDSLSEIAASADCLGRLKRLLRPQAPLVAGEPAPSLFWDLVRGIRSSWWTRSASSAFPVGALLTGQEWVDELKAAGFAGVSARPLLGEESIGVVLQAAADMEQPAVDSVAHEMLWRWEGADTTGGRAIRELLGRRTNPAKAEESALSEKARGLILVVDGRRALEFTGISSVLGRLAEFARAQAAAVAPLSVLVDLGDLNFIEDCSAHPVWAAVTAALRVVQNEYANVRVRCIGFSGPSAAEQIAEEIANPTDERELCFVNRQRFVFRLERDVPRTSLSVPDRPEQGLQLASRAGSARGPLDWVAKLRQPPDPGAVEIAVKATGLNFRDVMWNLGLLPEEALEDGYAGASLGMECAGIVTAVGPDVVQLAPGDRVVAFVSGGFASHVNVPAGAVWRLPADMSFEAAASIPVAFLTAYYSLVHLAQVQPGETVLVHGGAGAVGLAALQIARHLGATVIATAGSEEKRALLRRLGAGQVFNSRTLAFADDVISHTDGRGVDVVVNSLAGEAMIRSMDCLRPFGRFIELGKRDFYANTQVGLRPFRRNLAYFGVDVDQLMTEHRELSGKLFRDLLGRFESGEFSALPRRVFPGEQIAEAFRLMQRSGHIGKIVVTPATHLVESPEHTGTFPISPDGWHIIVGGTGGFGFAAVEWLVERGARHVVLASRSGIASEETGRRIEELRLAGSTVRLATLDVTDVRACDLLVADLQRTRPIKGVMHAAMVLEDRLIENMDQQAIEKVSAPKIAGALNLEALIRKLKVDYFLLFSSATTLLGNPGQFNYVAANAFLEGFAQRARRAGVPAVAIAWGGIEDAGYLARNIHTNPSLRKRFASSLLSAKAALDGLDLAFDAGGKPVTGVLTIAQIDWPMAKRELALMRAPFFSGVLPSAGARQAGDAAATLEKLKAMSFEDASAALLDMVAEEIARVLRLPPKEIDRHRPLAEIGMDSLMMLELRATVEVALQVELPMMSLANGITPSDIARRIASLLLGNSQAEGIPGRLLALSGSHLASEAETADSEEHLAAVKAVLTHSKKLKGPL